MAQPGNEWLYACRRADLEAAGRAVVALGGHTVALFLADGQVYAVDNRCPHMGFPLSRGTVADGLLTCHWHHGRFDLCSGGTFDPFADNVHSYPVREVDGELQVDVSAREDGAGYWQRRLVEGMEQSLNLVVAKSVLALLAGGVEPAAIAAIAGRFGVTYRDAGWGSGMTILTALLNVLPCLEPDDRALALTHGVIRVAQDTTGRAPRFPVEPLPSRSLPVGRLESWFRRAVEVRDEEGAERALHTCLVAGAGVPAALHMLYAAATDRYFVDDGHEIDFITKAAEYLRHLGPEQSGPVLGSLVSGLCRAQRSEELYAWRYPVDLPALVEPALARLAELELSGSPRAEVDLEALAAVLLGDDPAATVNLLSDLLAHGAEPAALGRAVAYAAALRLARFPISNEFGDWETVHNTWSSCHALYRALELSPSRELCRGLFHAAMALYLDRFLNVPAARLPEEGRRGEAGTGADLLSQLEQAFDRQQQVDEAGTLVHSYLAAGNEPGPLLATLGHLALREEAGFHWYQTLDAGVRLYRSLETGEPAAAARVLVGVARYLAAHCPTTRALNQTARIALRLHRGEAVFEDEAGVAL